MTIRETQKQRRLALTVQEKEQTTDAGTINITYLKRLTEEIDQKMKAE